MFLVSFIWSSGHCLMFIVVGVVSLCTVLDFFCLLWCCYVGGGGGFIIRFWGCVRGVDIV